ncbi:MAG TPA: histidine kinase [Candidatus Bathyarchaeia archaeon]|nr:histidine kinase [Candidatus Bathyarchaeia archaeon]
MSVETSRPASSLAGSDRLPNILNLNRAQIWGFLLVLYTGIFLLMFGYHYLDDLSRGRPGTFGVRFLEEWTGVYSVLLLLPLVLRVARYCFSHVPGWRQLAIHAPAAIAFSLAHTTLMAASRWIISPLVGMGAYDYGNMVYRYPMEMSNDLIGYTTTVLVYYFYLRMRMAQAHQLAAAELQTKLAKAQLENLRLQLQPHFLFNTLNTISSVMYEDVRAADAMLTQLSDLLRLTLRTASSHQIRLSQELQITRLYLEIMQKRYEDKLRVSYAVDPGLENTLVPQLILQPLVENSLRHGLRESGAGIDISIGARRENGSLVIQVADSGAGIGAANAEAVLGRGLGLANIRGRLEQLYGAGQEFAIANRATGGAEVTLRFPFHVAETPSAASA